MDKKMIITAVAALFAGVVLTLGIMFLSAQSIMLKEDHSKYDFEKSVEVFTSYVEENGWKIPTVHDLKETMNKFGKDVLQAKVFELCHPEHAYEILSRDKERVVMSMMPCRVAIYEKSDGKTYVSRMDTGLMGKMMKGVVPKVMKAASSESEELIKSITK
jgi:uncharacterized protein (DUF302 family)